MAQQIQPIFILPEGAQRSVGKDAHSTNIMAAKAVAETVRTTLGPKGMDKMLVDSMGDVTVTNDGVTILEEMNIEHPSAKMIVEIAKTQENEVGDGTTTAVVLAGELLKNAEELLNQNIHPTVVAKGYRIASEKAQVILNAISEKITKEDNDSLIKIATTAMTGKGAEYSKEKLAKMTVDAVKMIVESDGNIDSENVKIEKRSGAPADDSMLIKGVLIDKERVHPGMPRQVKNAKIALIDKEIEISKTEIDSKIEITSPDQMQAFLDQEEKMLKNLVEKILSSGANVVICQKGIDDVAQYFMSKKGVYAVRRVSESDMKRLARATGGRVVSNIHDLDKSDLGFSGSVEEKKVGDEQYTFIQDCKNPKAVTLLVRGGTEHVTNEIERAISDAVGDVIAALRVGKIVGGAGAVEIELSKQLYKFANSLSGKEQLAAKAFAQSLEVIPKTLAENAGLDPIDVLTELKAAHDKGQKWAGINVFTGKVMDAMKNGVVEPLKIKTQAVSSASEVAIMILRIDDLIAAGKSSGPSGGGPQMPPGMGGMGGEY
ncbi:MAG: thermosome [archaeon GW2011_AR3]|nr:MAG: thermosome [archaeon GW2011_AR3]MBS3109929.1 TCP-1/cpn60 chaperonin family protein [Candidatus Woesearchaeota archaeon]